MEQKDTAGAGGKSPGSTGGAAASLEPPSPSPAALCGGTKKTQDFQTLCTKNHPKTQKRVKLALKFTPELPSSGLASADFSNRDKEFLSCDPWALWIGWVCVIGQSFGDKSWQSQYSPADPHIPLLSPPQVIPELEKRSSSKQDLCNELLRAGIAQNSVEGWNNFRRQCKWYLRQWILYSAGFFASFYTF